jgi:hypothetical protein
MSEHVKPHVGLPDWGATDGLHLFKGKRVSFDAWIDGQRTRVIGEVVRVAPSQAFMDVRIAGSRSDGGGIKRFPEWVIERDTLREASPGEEHR